MAPNSVQSTSRGWMPGANRVAVPPSNFAIGNAGRRAAVLHITEGTADSALGWFQNASSQVSAHFVVAKSGTIWQCVSVVDTAYANGLSYKFGGWIDPEGNRVSPPWMGLTPPTNPNLTTISIEREGHYQDVPPDAQNASVVQILRFLQATFPTMLARWTYLDTLVGHCHIAPKHRANCPGPHVDFTALATAATKPAVSLPPTPKRYQARKIQISTRSDGGPPYAGELLPCEIVAIDATYPNGLGHLADGRGFVELSQIEETT